MEMPKLIVRDPEILGGTAVFAGTRVPLHSFFDYLMAGASLDEFLDDFPTVEREQALALLEHLRQEVCAPIAARLP